MIKETYYISGWCTIREGTVCKNGTLYYKDSDADTAKDFAKGLYAFMNLKYSKFHKMDSLCKLGFLASELLLTDRKDIHQDTALVMSNKASSLDTDRSYQESINDRANFYPSPSVFVYTLPNIVMGEISIRHHLKSENAFFVTDYFDASFHTKYANILLSTKKASQVICGWVDLDTDKYDVFLALIAKKGKKKLTQSSLHKIYNQ
ncbi:hypothetical protein GCM10022393_19200 [Aquimarina addita]|uniref:3-oxoacyl-ACP synthase n=1 Tax=Aquimarina addita TaxID=870485 RepID=A0ABP6UL68_9FLAO